MLSGAWIGTVHTAVFADQPFQFVVCSTSENRITVHDLALKSLGCRTPQCYCRRYRECRSTLNTHLTGFTADTGGDVDEFRHFSWKSRA